MNIKNIHYPRKPLLDPDRDFRFFPGNWDLSSLPEPASPVDQATNSSEKVVIDSDNGQATEQSEASAKFFADLQIDPYLDGDGESSKRDCSIY